MEEVAMLLYAKVHYIAAPHVSIVLMLFKN